MVARGTSKAGFVSVGDLDGCLHYKLVNYDKIKFLVIALKDRIEIYAWAPKPYHKFMAYKVSIKWKVEYLHPTELSNLE